MLEPDKFQARVLFSIIGCVESFLIILEVLLFLHNRLLQTFVFYLELGFCRRSFNWQACERGLRHTTSLSIMHQNAPIVDWILWMFPVCTGSQLCALIVGYWLYWYLVWPTLVYCASFLLSLISNIPGMVISMVGKEVRMYVGFV